MLQNMIRDSQKRVSQDKRNNEAARLRSFRQNAVLLIVGILLLGSFAVINIVLLESVLRSPIGSADDIASSRMGPLLQERLRQKSGATSGGGLRAAVNGMGAAAARHFGLNKWAKGKADDRAGEVTQAMTALDLDKQERVRLQAMRDALAGHNASAGDASQALKQALGLVPAASGGSSSPGQAQEAAAVRKEGDAVAAATTPPPAAAAAAAAPSPAQQAGSLRGSGADSGAAPAGDSLGAELAAGVVTSEGADAAPSVIHHKASGV